MQPQRRRVGPGEWPSPTWDDEAMRQVAEDGFDRADDLRELHRLIQEAVADGLRPLILPRRTSRRPTPRDLSPATRP